MKLLLRRELCPEPEDASARPIAMRFLMHVRMEAAPRERELIEQFQLGGKDLYSGAGSTAVSLEKLLGDEQTIRFGDFEAMLEAEKEMHHKFERLAELLHRAHRFQQEQILEHGELAGAEDEPQAVPTQAAAERGWRPIRTAPLGAIVLLWHREWRHPFPGRRTGDHGAVWVDNCEPISFGWDTFATHWMPLPVPPPDMPTEAE